METTNYMPMYEYYKLPKRKIIPPTPVEEIKQIKQYHCKSGFYPYKRICPRRNPNDSNKF